MGKDSSRNFWDALFGLCREATRQKTRVSRFYVYCGTIAGYNLRITFYVEILILD
jgi:hypothetical protein